MSEEKSSTPALDLLTHSIANLERQLKEKQDELVNVSVRCATQQVYIREISEFHRTALLPLIAFIKQILAQIEDQAQYTAKLGEIRRFVQSIEEKTKHYESQALVDAARQAAIDEQKRLLVKST